MKNAWIGAGVVGVLAVAWHFGQAKKVAPPVAPAEPDTDVVVSGYSIIVWGDAPAEPPKPLAEGLDLSRAFNPGAEEEVSPLVLASFQAPDDKPAPPPASRYRPMLVGVDALNLTGFRLGWLSVPLPTADVLTIMPREVK